MARYTGLFTIATSLPKLRNQLAEVLESCNLDIIYETEDYMMAREVPGRVTFAKLVSVEVLIDRPIESIEEVRMRFVVKNEELPLQKDNHCAVMFETVKQAISNSDRWQLLENIAG
ncbi:hypothetical protein IQ235_10375 [Oscillatoriales cyanobacterium LEGE 11467]|uniref:Uncharacterized protein n=1 Tax=Zarconia navalis LEGE 11467 TaxID=1828826 RepID=A0A928Z8Z1_9CYAN|nr:hypothetical protein [Zarconia navalis]MBE9041183.1 hypothetical protein [Zarconia navalis LEGE 11467]